MLNRVFFFTVSVFSVICDLLDLQPRDKNKHMTALCNLCKAGACVTL